jgi:hypothetical protein
MSMAVSSASYMTEGGGPELLQEQLAVAAVPPLS